MLQYEAALVVPTSHKGFLGGTLVKNPPANAEDSDKHQFNPWTGKIL